MKKVWKLSPLDVAKEGDRIYRKLEPNDLDWNFTDQMSGRVIILREIETMKHPTRLHEGNKNAQTCRQPNPN